MSRAWRSGSVEATREIGRRLGMELRPDGCLLLYGELGSGKTALVQGIAEGLGLNPDEVQSPTFTLLAEHRAPGVTLFHLDLYRVEPEEVAAAGFEEVLLGPGVKAVEWAERLPFPIPGARVVRIRRAGEARRLEELEAPPEAI